MVHTTVIEKAPTKKMGALNSESLCFADVLEEDGGDVALTEVRQDDHDGLALELWACSQLQSSGDVRASGDANEQTLVGCQLAGGCDCLLVGGGQDLVEKLAVENLRDEVCADALDLVRTCVTLGKNRESEGSTAARCRSGFWDFR